MKPAIEHTSTSRLLFLGSGLLTSLTVSANGGASNCQIYDGNSTADKPLFNIGQLDGSSVSVNLGVGVAIERGIYVECADANIKVTVGFLPDDI